MLVKDLIPRVRSIYGDEESPYLISDNVLWDTKIPSGIDRFNLKLPEQFIITGTTDDAIISIEPRAEGTTRLVIARYSLPTRIWDRFMLAYSVRGVKR